MKRITICIDVEDDDLDIAMLYVGNLTGELKKDEYAVNVDVAVDKVKEGGI